jgi:hypothetical protein
MDGTGGPFKPSVGLSGATSSAPYRISTRELHWEALDEDISIADQADQTTQSVVPSA